MIWEAATIESIMRSVHQFVIKLGFRMNGIDMLVPAVIKHMAELGEDLVGLDIVIGPVRSGIETAIEVGAVAVTEPGVLLS
ncbi:MAG: hypothetical protein ACR5LC_07710 [Symbiopectobacterium sp.]|uniref:hypothetical protein n=1 Tax=Symbiopectobacterium sp. TaxID=2952789 RepID=UPI003F3F6E67